MMRVARLALLPVALAALAGCASFSSDGGMSMVAARLRADEQTDATKIADDEQDAAAAHDLPFGDASRSSGG